MARARINTSYFDLPEHRRIKSEGAAQKSNDAWSFVKQDRHLCSNNKVRLLALKLGMRRVCAVGILVSFWENVANDTACQYGEISSIDPLLVENWVEWDGEAGALYAKLVEMNFIDIDSDGRRWVHDWWDFAGDYLQQRDDKRLEMRSRRESEKATKTSRKGKKQMFSEQSGNVAGTPLKSVSLSTSNTDHDRNWDQGEASAQPEVATHLAGPLASPLPTNSLDRDQHESCQLRPEPEVVTPIAGPQPQGEQRALVVASCDMRDTRDGPGLGADQIWSILVNDLRVGYGVIPRGEVAALLVKTARDFSPTRQDVLDAYQAARAWYKNENGLEKPAAKAVLNFLHGDLHKQRRAAETPDAACIAGDNQARPRAGGAGYVNYQVEREHDAVMGGMHRYHVSKQYGQRIAAEAKAKKRRDKAEV